MPVTSSADPPHRPGRDVDDEKARRAFPIGLEDDLPGGARRLRRYLRQNAIRCQPKGRTQERGSALKVATKHVL